MKIFLSTSIILLTIMLVLPTIAEAHYSWCTSTRCYCGGGYAVPLDGGLSFLAVAGAGYGISRFRAKKRENKSK